MAAMESDPIVVKIINENTAEVSTGGKKESSGSLGGAVGKITAIAAVTTEILGLVKEAVKGVMAPLNSMIKGVMKLLAQFLRPAIDLIMIQLMPIMTILKPLVKVFNDVMRPFRTIAYKVIQQMGSAGTGVAMQIMTQGFMTGLVNVIGEFVKVGSGMILSMMKTLIFYPLADFLPWFDRDVVDKVFNGIEGSITGTVDTALQAINNTSLTISKSLAGALGVATDGIDFATPMGKAQTKMQQSLNDFWNNLTISNLKTVNGIRSGEYTTSSGGRGIAVDINDVNARGTATAKKYGIENARNAAEAFQMLRSNGAYI